MYFLKMSQLFLFFYFINEVIRLKYPEQYQKYIIFIVYNYIYYSSKIELIFLKIQNKYPKIKNYLTYFKNTNLNDVEFILDNKVIYKTSRKQINDLLDKLPTIFDFIIYSESNSNNSIVNKCLLNVLPNNFINYNCAKTDYKFILLEIEIDNKKIKLDLQTDSYNFFMCNNVINLKFLYYFLNTYYKFENINFENKNVFKINLIDHNMNSLSTNSINIRLNKTNYDFLENNNENNNTIS